MLGIARQVLIIAIALVIVIGGLIRLLWDAPKLLPVDLKRAVELAQCFAPRGEIPAGSSSVAVVPVHAKTAEVNDRATMEPRIAKTLSLQVSAAVPIELPDAALRADLDKGAPGAPIDLKGTQLTLAKGKGEFHFVLEGTVEIRRSGARSLLMARQPVRFGPAEGTSYTVIILPKWTAEITDAGGSKKQAVLPAGTVGKLELDEQGQTLVPLQPLATVPWAYDTPVTLVPVRAAEQKGLGNLSIEARQPGMQFNAPGVLLTACVFSSGNWQRTGVTDIRAREPGAATILITLPDGTLPTLSAPQNMAADVELAVASTDGQYVAYGGFKVIDRVWAAVISLLLTGCLFGWLLSLRRGQLVARRQLELESTTQNKSDARTRAKNVEKGIARWLSGLFIGPDNDPSLSLFQIFIWTVITVWGLAYVFLVTGRLLSLTPEMMTLLGIAGAGSVLARWIAERGEGGSTSQSADSRPAETFEFWQMLSTKGQFDLLKLQLLVFTLMIAAYVLWQILDTGAFPALDPNMLLLLGVSQGIYIGGKVAGTSALSRAQTIKLELDLKNTALPQLTAEKETLEKEKKVLDDEKKALASGQELSDDKKKRLNELDGLIKAKDKQIQDTRARISDLKSGYDAAVKELGLT